MRIRLVLPLLLTIAAVADAQPTPVILDLPLGADVDAAFALAYALASPHIDVRGITTVGDQADARAWIACRFLTHSQMRKIPVAAGAEPQPKLGIDWQIQYRRHPAPIFNRTQKPEKESAVAWLHRTLKDEKVKPTILALGPASNIARLLKEHPEDAERIERVLILNNARVDDEPTAEAKELLRSKVALGLVTFGAGSTGLDKAQRDELFAAHSLLTFQLQNLDELASNETPSLFGCVAVAAVAEPRLVKWREVPIDNDRTKRIRFGLPSDANELIAHMIRTIKAKQPPSLPAEPKNVTLLVDGGGFPAKVHVAEDFDTDIEKRWWMSGKAETKDAPPAGVLGPAGVRCLRGVLTQDFDDRQGNMKTSYRAVVFNPVPGPPMGKNTRLSFRYKLEGTARLRIQLYSLTNGYHRYLSVKGLRQHRWQSGAVDMTEMRRPDGSGGPLSENERIDDIQFYVDPRAQVLIDDVVLYDAADDNEKRPFPKRILYTAWFDTGKHGKEWLGDFEIVNHQTPRSGKAAKSVANRNGVWIRLDLKGRRRLGDVTSVSFKHHIAGTDRLRVELANTRTGKTWTADVADLPRDRWSESTTRFAIGTNAETANEVRFLAATGATVTVDDVLVYEP